MCDLTSGFRLKSRPAEIADYAHARRYDAMSAPVLRLDLYETRCSHLLKSCERNKGPPQHAITAAATMCISFPFAGGPRNTNGAQLLPRRCRLSVASGDHLGQKQENRDAKNI